jgi:hypothetical protein
MTSRTIDSADAVPLPTTPSPIVPVAERHALIHHWRGEAAT